MKTIYTRRNFELGLIGLIIFLLFSPLSARAGADSTKGEISWFFLCVGLFGGLSLFLYGMERMSDALKNVAGEKMKDILGMLSTKRIMGVCLGKQAIAEVFGAKLYQPGQILHGVATNTIICDTEEPIYQDLPKQFSTVRYHSWAVERESMPMCLKITALSEDGMIMSLRHNLFDVCGVQYHPESIKTEYGSEILKNWLAM